MGEASFIKIVLAVGLVTTLSACEEGLGPSFLQKPSETAAATTEATVDGQAVGTDVEAPEVFSASEAGLWAGRPSRGGVWGAHPDVKDPERVLIRNASNDQSVIGALFRRERNTPGPAIQVSSAAAEALGLLAGQPTGLEVVALRTVEAPLVPELTVSDEAPGEDAPGEEAQGEEVVGDEASSDEAVAAASTAAISGDPAPASVETQALDPVASTAAAAIAAAEALAPSSGSAGAQATAQPVATTEVAAAPAPAPSQLTKPFIQIGIFSVQQNASNTATSLRREGILPTVKAQESRGKKFWRVIVGPAQNSEERAELLKKIKSQGFSDAYFVTNLTII